MIERQRGCGLRLIPENARILEKFLFGTLEPWDYSGRIISVLLKSRFEARGRSLVRSFAELIGVHKMWVFCCSTEIECSNW